jgi:hypothetical protein
MKRPTVLERRSVRRSAVRAAWRADNALVTEQRPPPRARADSFSVALAAIVVTTIVLAGSIIWWGLDGLYASDHDTNGNPIPGLLGIGAVIAFLLLLPALAWTSSLRAKRDHPAPPSTT